MIVRVKVKGKTMYRVKSHTTGRTFGTYPTKAQAVERLRQMKGHSRGK